jgi:hypothetical protein
MHCGRDLTRMSDLIKHLFNQEPSTCQHPIPVLQDLQAGSTVLAAWTEPRGVLSAVVAEVAPGRFVNVTLGAAGVVIGRGEAAVGIPLAELLNLATAAQARKAGQ